MAGGTVVLAGLAAILSLAAYVDRVYSEMGKFLTREYQDNIDAWEERVEPRLKLGRESIALSASMLRQLSLAGIALVLGVQLLAKVLGAPGAVLKECAVTVCELVVVILVFDRLVPQVLFSRTRGQWLAKIRWLLQGLFFVILPVTLLLGLLLSIVALAEPEDAEEEDQQQAEAMDALLEAGEEEGILEESDRELVRSVVEFGDKVVREVMTPRPEIFAVRGTLTLKEFTEAIEENVFSRVPVYKDTLDNVTGIAFAHDLLQVSDEDAETRTVAQIQRSAEWVFETKPVAELLREMQRAKQHMRIVVDEHGGVAGIVTIEDLLEAIVGNIADEHDEPEDDDEPVREESGAYVVSGRFELSRLRELFADQIEPEDEDDASVLRLAEGYESTTVGGLVSEIAGHIPLPGEVVEEDGLRMEVLASTDRRIERVRVGLVN
jgi:CBS domain containing-hemolysin-like protein